MSKILEDVSEYEEWQANIKWCMYEPGFGFYRGFPYDDEERTKVLVRHIEFPSRKFQIILTEVEFDKLYEIYEWELPRLGYTFSRFLSDNVEVKEL
jgi:hypothetical protein